MERIEEAEDQHNKVHNEWRKKSVIRIVLNSGVALQNGSYNLFALKWVDIDTTHKLKWIVNIRTHS